MGRNDKPIGCHRAFADIEAAPRKKRNRRFLQRERNTFAALSLRFAFS
jgi:hypothetical protein